MIRPLLALLPLCWIGAAVAAPDDGTSRSDLAAEACAAIAARVDAIPGDGPLLLRSYDGESGEGAPTEPALATAAFTYDNALAAIALVGCGRVPAAVRIAAALRGAAMSSRVRNAYRAGAADSPPVPNGWWDASNALWAQDSYQAKSAQPLEKVKQGVWR